MELGEINRIAVLGAGNMGHGIAEVAALAGYEVTMQDVEEELVQEGYESIEWSLDKLAEKGRIDDDETDAALDRVTPLVDLGEAVGDADVVIEAVPEKMELKKDVYADVEAAAPDGAIFATNTSGLSITELAEVTDRPERVCGMHFFNPPVRMDLVEIIPGTPTADETLDAIEALAEDVGKTPVRVRKDSPGFVVNRVLVPLMNEAAWIVHGGDASIAEVDSTAKYGMGLPMGTFELADLTGIDVGYHVLEYMHAELGDAYEPCPLLEEKVENEQLGEKTGEGFYDYGDGEASSSPRADGEAVDGEASSTSRADGEAVSGEGAQIPTDAVREDVERRLLAVMADEVAGLIGDGVADPGAIDEALQLGAGFPEGPATMADDAGLASLVETLEDLREETGAARYEVKGYLRELAESDGSFHGDGAEGEGDESASDFDTLSVEREGRVARLVLDRPHRMNTINDDLLDQLAEAVDLLERDADVRAILLTGEGDRAFSAGADVQSMAAGGADPIQGVELSRKGQRTFGALEECDTPVVAGIDGYCLGGGMELAACADLRIASERSELGQPEHDLGLLPGWGGTQRLQRIVGMGRAKEIIFTAERFDPETMAEYGFLNEVVPTDEFDERAFDLAEQLAGGPPIAQRYTKRAMLRGWESVEAGLDIENQAFGHLLDTDDAMEGVTAFVQDREPEFEGE